MFRRYRASLVLFAGLLFLAAQSTALAQNSDPAGKCRELQDRLVRYRNAPQGDLTAMAGVPGGQLPLTQAVPGPGGYLRSLSAPPGYHFVAPRPVKGDPTATAKSFLSEYGVLFGVTSKSVDFACKRISYTDGRRYVHLCQQFGGIPVFAGEMVVQVSEADGVECVMSDIATRTGDLDSGAISLKATISSADAQKDALALVAGEHPGMRLSAGTPTLYIYDPQVVGNDGGVRLAWEMVVVSAGAPIVDERILLDAHKCSLLLRYSLIKDALNRQIYDAANVSGSDGVLVRSEGGPATGIADADAAYNYLGDTYAFYFNEHARDSIDNAGMSLIAHVRYGPMENAFWDPSTGRVYFGEGFAADDVVAHEYTHGVTDHESSLIYMNQSGAINEAFSDIWGEFVDLTNGRGNDSPAVRWLCGEDVAGGAIRSLSDPPAYDLPDRMGSPLWYNGSGDNGGVHINMGVGSKLAYLLTDGATFNGYTITGMGIGRVADLFYETQANLLTSGAEYGDLYGALIQAALNLGWTSGEQTNLANACFAVEITNDSFASRKVIDAAGGTKTGTNTAASKEPGEPNHAGNSGGKSVWWTWTPANSGSAQIDTIGSGFDTLLGVYTGSSVSALTPVASDDNGGPSLTSMVTFTAVAGTAYQIAVDGYDGASGSITLHVIAPPVANDSFSNRIAVDPNGATVTGSNAGATKEPGEPDHAGGIGGRSVWWTWTPTLGGPVQIDTIGSSFDTLLGVYTGSSVAALALVADDDDSGGSLTSKVTFTAVAGTQYQIAVDGWGADTGSITLHVITPAANDSFANRIVISAGGATAIGTNLGATKESGEPNHAGNSGGKSVWWTWTPAAGGSAQIDTIGSGFDTLLGVYTGSGVSALTTVASDDDGGGGFTSKVTFTAVAGRTYQIAVDGYNGASGSIALHAIAPPPANDNFANRIAVSAGGAAVTGTNTGATKESGEPNHAGDSGGKSVWWTWTPSVSGNARIDTIGSSFDTILGVYTGGSVSTLTLVASDNDGGGGGASKVTFSAVAGTVYQIAVDGFGAAAGGIALNVIARDLAVSTASLPDGYLGIAYSQTLVAVGGLTPFAWSVSSGSLPEGLSINASTGEISGTPAALSTSSFTVTVTDSVTPAGTAEQALSIVVGIGELEVTTTSLPNATRDAAYSQTLAAIGGVAPYEWSVASGALPAGLSLDASTGIISGTPTATGTYDFTAQAADFQETPASATKALSITVSTAPTYQYLSSDPESSTTNTNYVNKVNMTLNTLVTDDWIIFGFCEFRCPNVSYATFVQLFIDGAGEGQNTRKPVDPTDYLPFISVKVKNLTPGAHTIQLKYRAGNAAAAAYVRNARVCAVRRAALEFYNVANDNAKPLTINSTDIAVLTWTPATTGNYLVISTAELNATTAVSTDLQTIYNGVVNDEGIMRAADNGDYTTFMSFNYCANAPAGVPITHKITGRKMASSTTNHYIRRARILTLRLSQGRFNNTAAGSGMEKTTTQTTFQEALTTTWTYGVSGNWLFLNSARVLNTSTSYQTGIRVQLNNSVTCADQIMRPKAANDLLNFSSIDIRSLTTPRQVDMDYRTTNAAGTAKVRRLRFYGLPLDTP